MKHVRWKVFARSSLRGRRAILVGFGDAVRVEQIGRSAWEWTIYGAKIADCACRIAGTAKTAKIAQATVLRVAAAVLPSHP